MQPYLSHFLHVLLENVSYPTVMKIFSNVSFFQPYCFAVHVDIYVMHLELTSMNVKFSFFSYGCPSISAPFTGEKHLSSNALQLEFSKSRFCACGFGLRALQSIPVVSLPPPVPATQCLTLRLDIQQNKFCASSSFLQLYPGCFWPLGLPFEGQLIKFHKNTLS